jgi:hypothetical protein
MTVPDIPGWTVQTYGNCPAVGNVRWNDPPGDRFPFQMLVSDVVV